MFRTACRLKCAYFVKEMQSFLALSDLWPDTMAMQAV